MPNASVSLKKITYTALFGGALLIQLLMPIGFAAAQIPGLGGVECGTPPINISQAQEVPTRDADANKKLEAIKSASKITCVKTSQQTLKDYVLDTLAYIAVHTILRAMTNMILGWIQGTDADFIQNLEDEFVRSADAEGGALLNELTGLNLCGNIGAYLKLSIGASSQRNFRQRMTCTVTQAVNYIEGFYRNFTQGGWSAFFKIALEPQNNAYGAFMLTMNEQAQRVDNKQISLQQRLLEGSGFMGFSTPRDTNCQRVSQEDAATLQEDLRAQQRVWGKKDKPEQSVRTDNADPENPTYSFCDVAYDTKTPGSLFSAALPEAAFSDVRRAQIADEINESVSEIVMALLNRVIQASSGSGQGILESRDVSRLPPVTPADAGFTHSYLTNRAEDGILRLQMAQKVLGRDIQILDPQIASSTKGIADAQAACDDTDPATICDNAYIRDIRAQKASLVRERTGRLSLLRRADQDIERIFDLREDIVATTNSDQLQILDTRLGNVLSDADNVVGEAGGPTPGVAGADANDNIVRMTRTAQEHADLIIAWLDRKIAEETDAAIKRDMEAARDALRILRNSIDTLRTEFLAAVASGSGVATALERLTDKINEINEAITADYGRFKAL